VPHLPQETPPEALDTSGLARIRDAFAQAAARAEAMGIEAVELHGAHGYLLHQFLSPVANVRTDAYGGSFENRIRFPLEVFAAVRQAYKGTLGMRLSATDWVPNGWTPEETADLSLRLKQAGADFIHISTGGVSAQQKIPVGPSYQVPFARMVKQKSGLPTIAVGLITDPNQANDIVSHGDADLVGIARSFLYKPRWAWEAAAALQGQVSASHQYWRCMPREAQGIFGKTHFGQR
jgi:2,4-dienoyl-CoA reductase-like NADH-dependent reductase (Old Yellow Enzyme family)